MSSIYRRYPSVGSGSQGLPCDIDPMDRLANTSEMRWMPLLYGVTAGLSCLVIVQLLVGPLEYSFFSVELTYIFSIYFQCRSGSSIFERVWLGKIILRSSSIGIRYLWSSL